MRVYYYTAEKYALSNIINARIKISLLDDLNDPFEFLGVDLSDRSFRKMFKSGRDEAAKIAGIISFSKDWNNPLLWSHYGDKHKGICLGFDVDDKHVKEVIYFPGRVTAEFDMDMKYGGLTVDIVENLFRTKYIEWEYENEVRIIVPLEEKDSSGFYFTDFQGNLELKEVILGPRSNLEIKQVAPHLASYSNTVKIFKSRIAFKKYEVVKNQSIQEHVHSA